MLEAITAEKINQFNAEIQKVTRQNVKECYQCGKCSAGCSVNWLMDYKPSELMRLAQLGQRKLILGSKAIWLCTACEICTERCPRNIDIASAIDAFRQMAVADNIKVAEHDIPLFHQYFLKDIKDFGRIHELRLVANFKLRSNHPLSDFFLGPLLFRKGKIKLDHSQRGAGVIDLKKLFKLKV